MDERVQLLEERVSSLESLVTRLAKELARSCELSVHEAMDLTTLTAKVAEHDIQLRSLQRT